MKKIGLITYHASHNIGSMMQTYAMLNIIQERYGHEVEIINFSSKKQQELYSFYYKNDSVKNVIKNIIITLMYPFFKKRYNDYGDFITNKFPLSGKLLSSTKEVADISEKYDVLICGSDQIWNVTCKDFDDSYFLPFNKKDKKIAYAPSLGGKNILNDKGNLDKYKGYLEDFDYISVREKNGVNWLSQLTDKEISFVPDPTLLFDNVFWDKLIDDKGYQEKYIFFYGAAYYKDTFKVLREISKKYNMPVIMFDHKAWVFKGNMFKGLKVANSTSPESYLKLIKNAEFVITTSFHGTIFSTIYHKNFWSITFKDTNPDDDRIITLLEQLGFEDRKLFFEEAHLVDLKKPVNYDDYLKNATKIKDNGLNYLDRAFNE